MNIKLRDATTEDLPIFFLHQQDSEATEMAGFPARDEESFYLHWKEKILGNQQNIKKTILVNDRVVGNMLCWKQSDEWYIGYWIGKEFWGNGIASLALKEFIFHCKIRPLFAHVLKHNKASIRVLEKNGFKLIGPSNHEGNELVFKYE